MTVHVTVWVFYSRVQMSDLSSFQTTSFHTHLSFLDKENDDDLLEDEDQEDYDENGEENNFKFSPSGSKQWMKHVRKFESYLISSVQM